MQRIQNVTLALMLALGAPAGASFAQAEPRGIEEIVVTAQKREQSAQDVGISLTAIGGEELAQGGFGSAQEVTALAAGVSTIQPNGEANYAIGIRGVANSDFTTNVESPVAIYLDEVYISQMSGSGFMLFDMERVEILRGPQGTLFGRNATGGLVHFVSRKPSAEREGYAKFTYGDYEQFKFEGALGGGGEVLSARLSLSGHWNDGYITNRFENSRNLNNANDKAGRLQFLLTPNDDVSLLVSLRAAEQDIRTGFFEHAAALDAAAYDADGNGTPGDCLGGSDLVDIVCYADTDGDVFAGEYDTPGHNKLETFGATATLNWNVGDVTLTSITDFSTVERDYIEDTDASPVAVFGYPVAQFFLTTDAEQFSQELRLSGSTDELTWVAGLYYLSLDIDDSNGIETELFSTAVLEAAGGLVDPLRSDDDVAMYATGLDNPYDIDTESWSVFGQVEYDLSEQLSVVGGFRWIQDDKEYDLQANLVDFVPGQKFRNGNPNVIVSVIDVYAGGDGSTPSYHGERDDGVWSARLGLDYHVSDDVLLYANWSRGVKGGGFNAPIFPVDTAAGNDYNDATLNYAPEELDAFEVGFKSTLAGGRVQLNGSAYLYEYNDYQAFEIVGVDTITRNADADSQGFELEVVALPAEGLTLRAGVAYNDIEVDLAGTKTTSIQSPEWNVNALLRYEKPLLGGAIAFQIDADYRSEHFFALSGTPHVREDGYTVANLSLSWQNADENWVYTFAIRNLTDEEYLVQTFDLTDPVNAFGFTEQYYGRPQWWSANVTYKF